MIAKMRKRSDFKKYTLDCFIIKDLKFARFYLLSKIEETVHEAPGRAGISNSGNCNGNCW